MKRLRLPVLAWALLAAGTLAHPDPRHSLEEIVGHLALTPADAGLHAAKAQIEAGLGERAAAAASLREALRLAPQDPAVLYAAAAVAWADKDPLAAHAAADTLLAAHPTHADGWKLLADVHQTLGRRDLAIAARLRVVEHSTQPRVGDFTDCAALLVSRDGPGDVERAIDVLSDGVRRVGNLTGLQYFAADLERRLGRTDAALVRLDQLAARYRPSPELSQKRGAILEEAGRLPEAHAAYDAAVALLDAMPEARRTGAPAVRKRAELVEALRRTAGR